MAAPVSRNFQPFTTTTVTENRCDICWESGFPESSLLLIHPNTSDTTASHLACRRCVVKCLKSRTSTDTTVDTIYYTCHICKKEIILDEVAAETLGINLVRLNHSSAPRMDLASRHRRTNPDLPPLNLDFLRALMGLGLTGLTSLPQLRSNL